MNTTADENKTSSSVQLLRKVVICLSQANSIMKEKKSQHLHWFRKIAETVPTQYLPAAFVGAVKRTVFSFDSTKNKMRNIREIIEIYDDLIDR